MNFSEIIKKIPVVENDVNYWMVRTNGGKFYDQFLSNAKIAMGSDYISPENVIKYPAKREDFFKAISPVIKENTESERPGLTASQFYRFYYEIKKNDIVVIPSESSRFLSIGRILDERPEVFTFNSGEDRQRCDHIHTRKVDWLTTQSRYVFNPNFISLLFAHNAIVDANEYKDFINGVLYDFFIQENTGHLVINVNTEESIKAKTLFYLFFELFDLTDDFYADQLSADDINIRINLNSPGKVELISKNIGKLSLVGMLIVFIAGGNFKCGDFHVGTDGVLKPILQFLTEDADRQSKIDLLSAALSDLNVKEPKELTNIIKDIQVAQK